MTARQDKALARVERRAAELGQARNAERKATRALEAAVVAARRVDVPVAKVARAAGVSAGRVSQITAAGHASHAQKNDPPAVRVTDSGTSSAALPRLTAGCGDVSGVVTVRDRRRYGRSTMFYDAATGAACAASGVMVPGEPGDAAGTLGDIIAAVGALDSRSCRVYLTGPMPYADGYATRAEAARAWALADVGVPEWRVTGAHLHESDKPVVRLEHDDGTRVTVMRAASWWGESDASVETCAAAWRGLETVLSGAPGWQGTGLADSPATAGRALFARGVPDHGWPVMSDDLRALIAATSGQGRVELMKPHGAPVHDFSYVDGRFMYAALTWGMPVGPPRLHRPSEQPGERELRGRGRWLVTARVPDDWAHVGLLMAHDDGGGWRYPRTPGETFTTWADGAEAWRALQHGWHLAFHEGVTWAEGKPLDSWTRKLVDVWRQCETAGHEPGRLAGKAVRAMLLHTLGAFASRRHNVSASCSADEPGRVPADAVPGSVRTVGDRLVWEQPQPVSAWSEQMSHPEWSATVWARARGRLADLALTVDPARIVGMATDALYLDGVPELDDDGKPGRFRLKGTIGESRPWPRNFSELHQLRDESETDR